MLLLSECPVVGVSTLPVADVASPSDVVSKPGKLLLWSQSPPKGKHKVPVPQEGQHEGQVPQEGQHKEQVLQEGQQENQPPQGDQQYNQSVGKW